MRFTLTIECDNAAFGGPDQTMVSAAPEVARLLQNASAKVQGLTNIGTLRDVNGNTVGRFEFEEE